jgi:malate dehydrogenase (oxaloacetate-decarboxylating)(NADP+)
MDKKEKFRQEALNYHSSGRKGKIEVIPTKSHSSQKDLSLAYSPGVAEPCKEIENDPSAVYNYTAKGNLVAVISNGTAVLGLGDIGPLASKPVMEGKGLLFKIFADIDVFDIEVDEKDPDKFIEVVKAISPTFGGINLEDIKAPEAFYIEKRLKEELKIPVMHDDQHGTAIISAAALLNAVEITNKNLSELKIVINGAGAAAISCAKLYVRVGAKLGNIIMLDSKGTLTKNRTDLTEEKLEFISDTTATNLEEAMADADVFIGLSKGNVVTPQMLLSMNANPIVFAMANPTPEIDYNLAMQTRPDIVMATGRSDHPNQVNNVLGFPFIFRGALDVQATEINEEMKLAAVHALADLTKEPVPEMVMMAYNERKMSFGKNYIIPKPFDTRLISKVSMAVAKAAMESGVATKPITNFSRYEEMLVQRLGKQDRHIRLLQNKAKANPKKVVFCNAEEYNVLKAAQIASDEGYLTPILLGEKRRIEKIMIENDIVISNAVTIDPKSHEMDEKVEEYAHIFWNKRNRKGLTMQTAIKSMKARDYFGAMMVEKAEADAVLSGFAKEYSSSLKPFLEVIGKNKTAHKVTGMILLMTEKGPLFFADTAVIEEPTWEDLAKIATTVALTVRGLGITPKIAMLSYETFTNKSALSKKVKKAVDYLHEHYPKLIVDGEMQPEFAFDEEMMKKDFPFSKLAGHTANIFIFPDLSSGHLSYKILRGFNNAQTVGPILLGMNKPAHIMQMRASVDEIVNLATVAVIEAQHILR